MSYIWTDDPIDIHQVISHVYITELRERTNLELIRRDRLPISWTDLTLNDTIKDKTVHIQELRNVIDGLCNAHLPAEKFSYYKTYDNNEDTTYKTNDDRTYDTNVESGLCPSAHSNYLSNRYSVHHPSEISGNTAYDSSIQNGMCSSYNSTRHLSVCNGAESSEDGGYNATDCPGNYTWWNTSEDASLETSDNGSLCPSQDISLQSGQ